MSFSVIVAGPRTTLGVFTRYDANGVFEIDDVPAGEYRVSVVADGQLPSDEQQARVTPAPSPDTLFFQLRRGHRMFGKISDRASKQPVPGARLWVEGAPVLSAMVPLTAEASSAEGEPPRIELVGIGAALALKDGAIILGTLTPEGGAIRAGLSPGDQILAIDDRPVQTLGGLAADVQHIRGAEGTQVLLRIRRASRRSHSACASRCWMVKADDPTPPSSRSQTPECWPQKCEPAGSVDAPSPAAADGVDLSPPGSAGER